MKSLGEQRTERVARTLCQAAATELQPACPMCAENGGSCQMWKSFMREASLVLRTLKK